MEEGNAVPFDHAAQGVVVGDDAGDLAIQLAAVPAVQQVGQAVGFATGHEHHALALGRIGDPPLHGEFPRDGREGLTEAGQIEGQ